MASNVKVLLVDDNPMIRAMLRQALGELAPVETATDGAEALLKIVEAQPDLVVSDYDMPSMNGRQLLEKLKSKPNTAKVPLILMASKSDITEKLKMIQDTVEDFVEKPFFIKEAIAHIKRVIDKIALEKMARDTSSDGTLRGSLAQMNCVDLLQSLEMGRKSCALSLSNNGEQCDVYFTDGQISHAVYGKLKGDNAVYKVLTWTAGNFKIDFTGTTKEQTTTRSTQGLLMEGLRLLDESNRDASAVGS
jgi:CheY-like chemotaxis protein